MTPGTLEERVAVLSRYVEPGLRAGDLDQSTVEHLLLCGYLRSGITLDFQETLKTTGMGRIYLRSYGILPRE